MPLFSNLVFNFCFYLWNPFYQSVVFDFLIWEEQVVWNLTHSILVSLWNKTHLILAYEVNPSCSFMHVIWLFANTESTMLALISCAWINSTGTSILFCCYSFPQPLVLPPLSSLSYLNRLWNSVKKNHENTCTMSLSFTSFYHSC